jgi:tRNA (guanine-N7-)-methyltransferase
VSTKNKLRRFAENLNFPNVLENYDFHNPRLYRSLKEPVDLKGKWNSEFFKNEFPVCLELACGGGEYCLGLSRLYSDKNFIGIDIKGARIWRGAKQALAENNNRVAFARTKIELIPAFFNQNEISEIWITFPDPFLKKSKSSKRLTSEYYLSIYKKILKPSAILHLKTDDETLYHFSLDILRADSDFNILDYTDNIYHSGKFYPEMDIKTYYELKHLASGKSIKYIRWQFMPQNH